MTTATVIPALSRPQHAKRSALVFLTPDEVLSILRTSRARSIRDWCMILLAYRHGLRASEVCNLHLDDLNFKDRSVTIARLKGSMRTVQPLYEHRGQPLLDEVRAIRQWLRVRREDGSGFLFLSQKGARLDRSQFFRVFQAIAEAAGLPAEKRHPHCLKHSLASHLVAGNVNLALIKQALGQRSISSTMVYRHQRSTGIAGGPGWVDEGFLRREFEERRKCEFGPKDLGTLSLQAQQFGPYIELCNRRAGESFP